MRFHDRPGVGKSYFRTAAPSVPLYGNTVSALFRKLFDSLILLYFPSPEPLRKSFPTVIGNLQSIVKKIFRAVCFASGQHTGKIFFVTFRICTVFKAISKYECSDSEKVTDGKSVTGLSSVRRCRTFSPALLCYFLFRKSPNLNYS